jgi:hypothetical protein
MSNVQAPCVLAPRIDVQVSVRSLARVWTLVRMFFDACDVAPVPHLWSVLPNDGSILFWSCLFKARLEHHPPEVIHHCLRPAHEI